MQRHPNFGTGTVRSGFPKGGQVQIVKTPEVSLQVGLDDTNAIIELMIPAVFGTRRMGRTPLLGSMDTRSYRDSWYCRKPQLSIGRHELMAQAFEEHQLLSEPEPETSQPQAWCSEIELADFHQEIEHQIAEDAYWASLEQQLICDSDDTDLVDTDIVEVMGVTLVDAEEVCEDIDAWRHSPDLLDNFDDEVPFIGYFN